jgi:hypothetical protein
VLLRPFLNDAGSCASYLFGCTTHRKLAVVDPHADLVDMYLSAAAAIGAPSRGFESAPFSSIARGTTPRACRSDWISPDEEGGVRIRRRIQAGVREALAKQIHLALVDPLRRLA